VIRLISIGDPSYHADAAPILEASAWLISEIVPLPHAGAVSLVTLVHFYMISIT